MFSVLKSGSPIGGGLPKAISLFSGQTDQPQSFLSLLYPDPCHGLNSGQGMPLDVDFGQGCGLQ